MKKNVWIFIFTLLFGVGLASNSVFASTDVVGYSVKANIPDNQIDKDLTYFDLRMQPGDTQIISLTVQNNSKETLTLMIEPNTAITNQNGVIVYSSNNHKNDSSLKYAFSDIVSSPQKVTLAGEQTKEVQFTIEMPEESFDGIILGGFYIYSADANEGSSGENEMIKNKYAYVVGTKLSNTDTEVKPNLTLNEVEATLINYRTAITTNLQNTEAMNIKGLEVTAKITEEGKEKVLREMTKTGMSMAPNSNFDFPITWDNEPLEPGEYHLYLSATDGDQIWEFEKAFEITDETASNLNTEAIDLKKGNTLLYVGIALLIIVCGVFLWILWIKKKGKENGGIEE